MQGPYISKSRVNVLYVYIQYINHSIVNVLYVCTQYISYSIISVLYVCTQYINYSIVNVLYVCTMHALTKFRLAIGRRGRTTNVQKLLYDDCHSDVAVRRLTFDDD